MGGRLQRSGLLSLGGASRDPVTMSGRRSLRSWVGRSGWNLIVSSGGEVATRVLSVVATVVLARYFGVGTFGDYATITAYASLAVAVGNLGIDQLAYRELSAEGEAGEAPPPDLFRALFALRMVSAAITAALLVGIGLLYGDDRLWPFVIVAVAAFPSGAAAMYAVAFQSRERFSVPARANALGAACTTALVLLGVAVQAPFVAFFGVLFVGDSVRAGYLLWARTPDLFAPRQLWTRLALPSRSSIRAMLVEAGPYWVLSILGMVYFRIDVVMLDTMQGPSEVGLYASASRFFNVINTVPALCLGVLFPRFARLQRASDPQAKRLYLLAVRVMLWAGAVAAVLGVVGAGPLIGLTYGLDYADAIPALRWLMAALLFVFWQAPNVTALFSGGQLRGVVALSFATAGFNVVANLFAIPQWGATGAAMTTAASELLSLGIFSVVVARRFEIPSGTYLRSLLTVRVRQDERDLLLGRAESTSPRTR